MPYSARYSENNSFDEVQPKNDGRERAIERERKIRKDAAELRRKRRKEELKRQRKAEQEKNEALAARKKEREAQIAMFKNAFLQRRASRKAEQPKRGGEVLTKPVFKVLSPKRDASGRFHEYRPTSGTQNVEEVAEDILARDAVLELSGSFEIPVEEVDDALESFMEHEKEMEEGDPVLQLIDSLSVEDDGPEEGQQEKLMSAVEADSLDLTGQGEGSPNELPWAWQNGKIHREIGFQPEGRCDPPRGTDNVTAESLLARAREKVRQSQRDSISVKGDPPLSSASRRYSDAGRVREKAPVLAWNRYSDRQQPSPISFEPGPGAGRNRRPAKQTRKMDAYSLCSGQGPADPPSPRGTVYTEPVIAGKGKPEFMRNRCDLVSHRECSRVCRPAPIKNRARWGKGRESATEQQRRALIEKTKEYDRRVRERLLKEKQERIAKKEAKAREQRMLIERRRQFDQQRALREKQEKLLQREAERQRQAWYEVCKRSSVMKVCRRQQLDQDRAQQERVAQWKKSVFEQEVAPEPSHSVKASSAEVVVEQHQDESGCVTVHKNLWPSLIGEGESRQTSAPETEASQGKLWKLARAVDRSPHPVGRPPLMQPMPAPASPKLDAKKSNTEPSPMQFSVEERRLMESIDRLDDRLLDSRRTTNGVSGGRTREKLEKGLLSTHHLIAGNSRRRSGPPRPPPRGEESSLLARKARVRTGGF